MPPLLATGALLLGALQVESIRSPSISWSVETGINCPTQTQLEEAYVEQSVTLVNVGPVTGLVEVSRSNGGRLEIRLSIPAIRLTEQRELAVVKGTCRDLAESIAILVHAWLADLPGPEGQSIAAEPPPIHQAHDSTVWGAFPKPEESPTPARVTGRDAKSPSWIALSLGLGVGAWLPFGGAAAPSFSLEARLRVSRAIVVGLLAMWVTDQSIDDAPYGSLLLRRQLFGASFNMALPTDRLELRGFGADLVAALVVLHANAQSMDYPVNVQRDLWDPGLLVGARVQQLLTEVLFLQAQVSAIALTSSYTFQVRRPTGETAVLATSPTFGLDLEVGVGVQIF